MEAAWCCSLFLPVWVGLDHPLHAPVVACLLRSQTYKELAQWEKAIENFEQALKVDPKYVSAHRFLGMLMHGLGRHRVRSQCLFISEVLAWLCTYQLSMYHLGCAPF